MGTNRSRTLPAVDFSAAQLSGTQAPKASVNVESNDVIGRATYLMSLVPFPQAVTHGQRHWIK